ncbi:MAG: hypothetical protein WAT36_08425 [Chromatiaceae bacterium]
MAAIGILDNFQAAGDGWLGTGAGLLMVPPLDVSKMHSMGFAPSQTAAIRATEFIIKAPDPERGLVNSHPAVIIT